MNKQSKILPICLQPRILAAVSFIHKSPDKEIGLERINKAIFYIKYYAKKHDMVIERKATLDEECFEGVHKIHGYPYKKYVDVNATEEVNNGQPQYRTEVRRGRLTSNPH